MNPTNPTNRTALAVALLALAPWGWFVVRDLSPRFDAFAIGMPLFLGGGLVGALALASMARPPRGALVGVAASWLVFAPVVIVGPWTPQGEEPSVEGVRLAAANVRGRVLNPVARDDLLAQDADVLVVSETLPALLRPLGNAYEHRIEARGELDVVVYSRWPIERLEDPPEVIDRNGVAVQVHAPGGTFVLYAVHLPRPAFPVTASFEIGLRTGRALIDDVIAAIEAESRPVVLAGDLNLTDRSGGYRALAELQRDAARANWAGPTSVRWWPLLLRIDHIFVPRSWCSEDAASFAIADSDHRGVRATVGPCATSADKAS